mgnify:CR=1 FL=1
MSHVDVLLLPAIGGVIFFKRLFCPKARAESNLKTLPGALNRVLAWVLSFEARVIPRIKFFVGASIICVAQPARPEAETPGQHDDTPGCHAPKGSQQGS